MDGCFELCDGVGVYCVDVFYDVGWVVVVVDWVEELVVELFVYVLGGVDVGWVLWIGGIGDCVV